VLNNKWETKCKEVGKAQKNSYFVKNLYNIINFTPLFAQNNIYN